MAKQNLYVGTHKASNKKLRSNWDQIKWDSQKIKEQQNGNRNDQYRDPSGKK